MSVNETKIREQILALLSRKDYRPLNKIEIANKLGVSGSARVALRSTLRDLERVGEIVNTDFGPDGDEEDGADPNDP